MPKILVVEDDLDIAQKITDWLQSEKYLVETCHSAEDGLDCIAVSDFDAIITDVGLPQLDGVQFCKLLRDRGLSVPILMLTGRTSIQDKEAGFHAGVDDYLSKPFDIRELMLRIEALLRRKPNFVGKVLSIGGLTLDATTQNLSGPSGAVKLQPKEYSLLEFFMRCPDQPFTVDALIRRLWPGDASVNEEIVYTYMTKLRKKIQQVGSKCQLKTSRGLGYTFECHE